MANDEQSTSSELRASGLVPRRLGAPKVQPWPKDLHAIARLSIDWQSRAASARFWEMGPTRSPNRMYEVAGLMGSLGEQLGLSCSADNEFQSWDLEIDDVVDPLEKEMAKRALAETMLHYVFAAGNSFFNLCCRLVALDGAVRPELKRTMHSVFPPFSKSRGDWKSFSEGAVAALEKVANTSAVVGIADAVGVATTLVRSAGWRALDEERAEGFHRWRLQSVGIVGAGQISPWTFENGVMSIEGGVGEEIGKDVPGLTADDVVTTVRSSRGELIVAMNALDLHFMKISPQVSSLRFTSVEDEEEAEVDNDDAVRELDSADSPIE
jgi:hypothetical protein